MFILLAGIVLVTYLPGVIGFKSYRVLSASMEPVENDPESLIVVIMQKAEQQVGLVIDELIGQQETVIKSLGHHITCDKLFSGATILGDGEVALILDTNTLM